MRIGSRSVVAVTLLAGSTLAMWWRGRLRDDYLDQLDPWVTCVAAALAVVAGTAAFQFWRLWERSGAYVGFRRGRLVYGATTRVRARELPSPIHRLIYITVFLWIALITLNNRAVSLLRDFPARISQSTAQYCPEVEAEAEEFDDPTKQGCRLVIRAYELGYADSLGSCAPEEEDAEVQVCHLRQHDEPYLHYAWRLLERRGSHVADAANLARAGDIVDRVSDKWDDMDSLMYAQHDAIIGAPRASHHLFTNLPDPRPRLGQRIDRYLEPDRCLAQYATMTHLLADDSEVAVSLSLEHVLGHLLFNPAFDGVVGYCREYAIHWNAGADVCSRLATDPEAVLAEHDALDDVRSVLGRHYRDGVLRREGGAAAAATPRGEADAIQSVVSFQCLVVGSATTAAAVGEHALALGGHDFTARELHVGELRGSERAQIELHKYLASLMAPGFGYGRLTSRASAASGTDDESAAQTAALLAQGDFRFAKLDFLRDADLFVGHDWLYDRPDVLEVYPYHVHMDNFINVFRKHYQRHRSRL